MFKINFKFVSALFALIVLFFGLGAYFDSRCEHGCLEVAIKDSLAKGGNNIDFDFDDFSFTHKSSTHTTTTTTSTKVGDVTTALPPMDGVTRIEILSVSTDWEVINSAESYKLTLTGAQKGWKVQKEGKKMVIQLMAGGADTAELTIPDSYKGELYLKTISGEVRIGEVMNLTKIQLESASGDIALETWPSESLEVNTVSGDLRVLAGLSVQQPQDITLHTVSADIDLEVKYPFKVIHTQTVSGSMNLQVPESVSFTYDMHSISGDFNGLPEGGTLKEGLGNKEMSGKAGSDPQPRSNVHFESVSGDFSLNQGPKVGKR